MNKPPLYSREEYWPSLPSYFDWQESCETLHMWMQIVGKIRMVQSAWVNHSWHVPLYVTTRGLTTSPIAYGMRTFQLDFDFIEHVLRIGTCEGIERQIKLESRTVADFYAELFSVLQELNIHIDINHIPNEVVDAVPFEKDDTHRQYNSGIVSRYHMVMVQADRIFKEFRARFWGKCSPVHFFWGSMDLAVTRFSGKVAPPHPGGVPHLPDWVVKEAYHYEVSSCGFWPGGGKYSEPAFYSYAYPESKGFAGASIKPDSAFYSNRLQEFLLPYEHVQSAPDPDRVLLSFLQSTYDAAAESGHWNRQTLDFPADPHKAA